MDLHLTLDPDDLDEGDSGTVAVAVDVEDGQPTDAAIYTDAQVKGELEARGLEDLVSVETSED